MNAFHSFGPLAACFRVIQLNLGGPEFFNKWHVHLLATKYQQFA